MRILIIIIFLASTAFGFFLKYLTYSKRNDPLPENVRDVFDEETYKKKQAYLMDKLKYSIVTGLISMVISLSFLLLNFHYTLYSFISDSTSNLYLTSMFILLVPILIANFTGKFVVSDRR